MRTCLIFTLLFMLVASCAPIPKIAPTSMATRPAIVLSPTSTLLPTSLPTLAPSLTVQPTLDFQTYDFRWCISDKEGDVEVPYLDVVKIDAIARGDTFIARIFVKSIPESLTFNREGIPSDYLEYSWDIWINRDGDKKVDSADYYDFADFSLSIAHFVVPGEATKTLSLSDGTEHHVWTHNLAYPRWQIMNDATLQIDYSAGIITLAGYIPVNAKSTIGFSTFDYNLEEVDRPDASNMVPPNTACT